MEEQARTHETFEDDALGEKVRLTFEHLPTMQITSFIVALTLTYLVRGSVSHARIGGWLLMILVIVASRIVLSEWFGNVREKSFDGEHWEKLYVILISHHDHALFIHPEPGHYLRLLFEV
jgi:hypothetical protein